MDSTFSKRLSEFTWSFPTDEEKKNHISNISDVLLRNAQQKIYSLVQTRNEAKELDGLL